MTHYLYLEAVNLGNVIDDTEDLSTRRAGGYMLLELVHRVKKACAKELEAISVGASAGLFQLLDGKSMAEARNKVAGVLTQPLYAQATVLVADTETDRISNSDFVTAREGLLAWVRRRQMQTLGFITDFSAESVSNRATAEFMRFTDPPQEAVCQIDKLRPAWAQAPFPGETRSASLSVVERREHGRRLRQGFYGRELKSISGEHYADDNRFTDDFEELAGFDRFSEDEATQHHRRGLPKQLDRKLAVFYADGDKFGATNASCASADVLRCWDQTVQCARQKFLRALLDHLDTHPLGRARPVNKRNGQWTPDRLRIETLMWGGDEFLLVLPAWLALDAVRLFFDTCRIEWPAGQRRTHSLALVFAHHNAPIGPLKQLAKALADQGKADKDISAAPDDSLNWLVLESFDHAGGDLGSYWARRDLPDLAWRHMALGPTRLGQLLNSANLAAIGQVPRRSLYRIVQLLQSLQGLNEGSQEKEAALRLLKRAYENVHQAVKPALLAWQAVWQALQPLADPHWPDQGDAIAPKAEHLNAWLVLTELWDYLLAADLRPCVAAQAEPQAPAATQEQPA